MKELEAIKERVEGHTKGPWEVAADLSTWESEEGGFDVGPDDAPAVAIVEGLADAELIAAAPKLLAALEAVEKLAEEWRYKGEFGWGAWQEGHGPDPEGHVLDGAAGDIRKAITEALA